MRELSTHDASIVKVALENNRKGIDIFIPREKPEWMHEPQWEQFQRYARGDAVPTDKQLIEGLSGTVEGVAKQWAWSSIPWILAGEPEFALRCQLIRCAIDPDLVVDEGL